MKPMVIPMVVFQSTLPSGERRYGSTGRFPLSCFNPRSHVGSDCAEGVKVVGLPVSIHAPTWGATIVCLLPLHLSVFQSTLPRGERPIHTEVWC